MYYACLISDITGSKIIHHYLSIIGDRPSPVAWCELRLLEIELGEGSTLIQHTIRTDPSEGETYTELYGAITLSHELAQNESLCWYLNHGARDSYIINQQTDINITRKVINNFSAIWYEISVAMIENKLDEAKLLSKSIYHEIVPMLIMFSYDDAKYRLAIFESSEQRKALHDAATSWGADAFDFEISA